MAPRSHSRSRLDGAFEAFARRPKPRIECSTQLNAEIRGHLHNALAGKNVYIGDTCKTLVDRYCPELYQMCEVAGFDFIPNNNAFWLTRKPPEVFFDIVRKRLN